MCFSDFQKAKSNTKCKTTKNQLANLSLSAKTCIAFCLTLRIFQMPPHVSYILLFFFNKPNHFFPLLLIFSDVLW